MPDEMDVEAGPPFGMDVEAGGGAGDLPAPDASAVADARRVVVAFLQEHRAEELVPDHSRVVVVDEDVRLCHAFRALLDNGIRAAPIVSSRGSDFVGMLTVSDIIDCLRHFYYESVDRNVMPGLESHTVSSWRAMSKSPDIGAGFRYVDAEASLYEACRLLRDLRIHRLPILSDRSLLLCTLEHWRVLRFVHQHLAANASGDAAQAAPGSHGPPQSAVGGVPPPGAPAGALPHGGPVQQHPGMYNPGHVPHAHHDPAQQHHAPLPQGAMPVPPHPMHNAIGEAPPADLFNLTLAQLRIGTYTGMVTVRQTDSLLHVLETMTSRGLSAVPVVDDSMTLCNVYSRTDITVLGRQGGGPINLDQTVMEALAPIRGPGFHVQTCRRSDTLRAVFERFEKTRKHRLYAVSDHGHVEGVLSLSDLLEYFLQGF